MATEDEAAGGHGQRKNEVCFFRRLLPHSLSSFIFPMNDLRTDAAAALSDPSTASAVLAAAAAGGGGAAALVAALEVDLTGGDAVRRSGAVRLLAQVGVWEERTEGGRGERGGFGRLS